MYTNYLCKKLSDAKLDTLQALFESECADLMALRKESNPEITKDLVLLEPLFTAEEV